MLRSLAGTTVLLVTCLAPGAGQGISSQGVDRQLATVALLYNFSRFIEWPDHAFESTDSPIIIAVFGDDPLVEALGSIQGKRAGGREIETRHYRTRSELGPCHILFYGGTLKSLGNGGPPSCSRHTLTVGAKEGFLKAGGMIRVGVKDDHLIFYINLQTARQADLALSARLVRLSQGDVLDEGPPRR